MSKLVWDQTGERLFETGTDHGVVYPFKDGAYQKGVAWNGLTAVTESPSGADPTPLYADNIKYLELRGAETFGATIEAYTYPDEFAELDGTRAPTPGMTIGQQKRGKFGFCYRTRVGNDVDGDDHGYKLHIIYGCSVSPSEKNYSTVNDTPEAVSFSWELTADPVAMTPPAGELYRPVACLTIDSTKVLSKKNLQSLETVLYGSANANPRLPLPDEVKSILTQPSTGN